jgi:hypothetical protein
MIRLGANDVTRAAASQFRIRDLLLATLAACVILAGGRMAGGAIDQAEALLLAAAMVSIAVAAVCLRRRAIWYLFLVAGFAATVFLAPGNFLMRWSAGGVAAAHFFFAALPVLAVGPLQNRWRWAAAAAGCQLTAAVFTPANAVPMIATAAPLSWLLAVAAVIVHYRAIPRPAPPEPPPRLR